MSNHLLKLFFILIAFNFSACSPDKPSSTNLKTGSWRGHLEMQGLDLPFVFEIKKSDTTYNITLFNSEEQFAMDQIIVRNDSLFFTMNIFDIDIKAKINGDQLQGVYVKNYLNNYELPFKAEFGPVNRFDEPEASSVFNGKWDLTFYNEDGKTDIGIGIFEQKDKLLTGTILTPTGDYRYLEGIADEDEFKLYTFDGNHAFIFNASVQQDSVLEGVFYSGKTFNEKFKAVKNSNAELPDANELTFLKDGYDKIAFSFPDLNGNLVSLNDPKYQDKVVILQLFGTWCPNCMDETMFYTKWYEEHKNEAVEIIALAYEAKPDFEYAKSRVEKLKERLGASYDFLIAGTYDKKEAAKTLPMLNHVMSFPTSIFIDKKGTVRKIHTGFSGPATGDYYLKYVDEFNYFMNMLLAEE